MLIQSTHIMRRLRLPHTNFFGQLFLHICVIVGAPQFLGWIARGLIFLDSPEDVSLLSDYVVEVIKNLLIIGIRNIHLIIWVFLTFLWLILNYLVEQARRLFSYFIQLSWVMVLLLLSYIYHFSRIRAFLERLIFRLLVFGCVGLFCFL